MMNSDVIGIDPGLKGCVAHYSPRRDHLTLIDNAFDANRFAERHFSEAVMALPHAGVAIVENVKMTSEWSAKANKTLQMGLGALGSLATLKSDLVIAVPVMTWKRALFLTSDKQLSMDVAHLRFPRHRHLIKRHDQAEAALLIAYHIYGDDTVEDMP